MATPHRRPDAAGITISLALLGFAGVIWWDATRQQLTATYGVGPDAAPKVIAGGLAVLALANLAAAWKGNLPHQERGSIGPLALILGGLFALIAIIAAGGGFIPATAVLFAATARAFGRRALLADLGIGLVLGVLAYLLFAKLLTLSLPMGPLEHLL